MELIVGVSVLPTKVQGGIALKEIMMKFVS